MKAVRAGIFVFLIGLGIPSFVVAETKPSQPTQPASEPHPAQIDRNGVLILIRSTQVALDQANQTGNYSVLRDLAAPDFGSANTDARLGEIFASQRAQHLDLSGVVVLDPQLTLLPQIESTGLMRMAGFFPSVPSQVNFELLFEPVNGRWRIFGIAVNVGSSTPAAPQPSVAPRAPASGPKPDSVRATPKVAISSHHSAKTIVPEMKPAASESKQVAPEDNPAGP